MTTKNSPFAALKAQADKIAKVLKGFDQGKIPDGPFAQKLVDARAKDGIKFGIFMDDKVITIEMPWLVIRETEEAGISAWIVRQMQETAGSAR
jgi:hypothetical protein